MGGDAVVVSVGHQYGGVKGSGSGGSGGRERTGKKSDRGDVKEDSWDGALE